MPTRASADEQLVLDEPDAVGQVVVAVLGLGLGGVERALEVVERGQQLLGELGDAAGLGRETSRRARLRKFSKSASARRDWSR